MRFDKEEEQVLEVLPPPLPSAEEEEAAETTCPPATATSVEEEEEQDDEEDEDVDESEVEDDDDDDEEDEDIDYSDDDDDDDDDEDGENRGEEEEEEDEEEEEEEEEEDEEEEEEEEEPCFAFGPTTASPYLLFQHGKRNCKQSFFSMLENNYSTASIPEMCGMSCCASSHGWLVMLDKHSTQCFLLNPVSMEKIQLPPMKIRSSYRRANCVLSSSPPNCVVMFVSEEHVSCIFCRPNIDLRWTRKVLGPNNRNTSINRFNNIDAVIGCKGKIYVSFWYGSGIKILDIKTDDDHHHIDEEANKDDTITTTTTTFIVEKIVIEDEPVGRRLQTFTISYKYRYWVESCGEIFQVIKIYWGGSGCSMYVFNLEVYKLIINSSSSSSSGDGCGGATWEKVECLGDDRLFFIGDNCSFSFSASKIGMKKNYIFFYETDDERLYSYNMEDQSISIELPCPNVVRHPRNQTYWILPVVV